MCEIDWSKAPDEATHYITGNGAIKSGFYVEMKDLFSRCGSDNYLPKPVNDPQRIVTPRPCPESPSLKDWDDRYPNITKPRSKYHRVIKSIEIDVYDVLHAYGVTNQADAHAIKKLLMAGQRGYKGANQDRREAIASIKRGIELESGNE